jgi:hypothetical protein
MNKPFGPDNNPSKGRPKGAKNKLASRVLQDLLEVWDEPIRPDSDVTRGKAALRIMSRERPADFAKLYASIMPREFWVDNLSDVSDAEIDTMIAALRDKIREEQCPTPRAPRLNS